MNGGKNRMITLAIIVCVLGLLLLGLGACIIVGGTTGLVIIIDLGVALGILYLFIRMLRGGL